MALHILDQAMLAAEVVPDLADLLSGLDRGAGFAVLTEESLTNAPLHPLSAWIKDQEEWSDFPFILLTRRGGGLERNPAAARFLELLGNATFLERPFHPTTLISLARSAIRGRRRQYEARARLLELNELAKDLERRVDERTRERELAVAQLHEMQKLETLGQLTGGVAHDFNNLLTPITGALDLLYKQYADHDGRAARLLGNALKAADRARILVQRLLGFARRQTLQMQSVNLASLIRGMHDLVASSIGPSIEIRIDADASLPPVTVDPNQLELAILNLCVNARDAMPDGGRLTLSVRLAGECAGPLPAGLKASRMLCLTVVDDGSGMSDETLARAIEPFYSTKELGQGTGLGLSMVHGLARQLGGGFSLSSELGRGTRVNVFLPLASDDVEDTLPIRQGARAPSSRPLSLLLVDDEELVRFATAEMLRDLGHSVVEVSNGPDALVSIERNAFDAVVTDYKMPRMDGAELAGHIRQMRPNLPVLIITGYTGVRDDALGLPRLSKPFGQAEIAQALESLTASDSRVIRLVPRSS